LILVGTSGYNYPEWRGSFFFANLRGEPKKNTLAMLEGLQRAKSQPLARVITGLSIRHVGPVAAEASDGLSARCT
jgi:NAD-dependent DNA ligase